MVEGARLESVYTGNRIEGSNPFLSAFFLSGVLPQIPDSLRFFNLTRILRKIRTLVSEINSISKYFILFLQKPFYCGLLCIWH